MTIEGNFLRSVLPSCGRYCVVSMNSGNPTNHKPRHYFTNQISGVSRFAAELTAGGFDTFFALASFGADRRISANALLMRSFFLDLDVGEGADKYPSPESAEATVRAFAVRVQLAPPTLVRSGYGLHAYWPLTEDVSIDDWLPLALRFKALCRQQGVLFDAVVPADPARTLRVPGTLNFKRDTPAPVQVICLGGTMELAEFSRALRSVEPVPVLPRRTEPVSATTQALLGNRVSNFGLIVRKSLKGHGCNAILHAVVNQADVEEPLWYSALSVAQHCEDRTTAIHKLSCEHPKYSAAETERKAAGAAHPHNCATFRAKAPHLCAGCTLNIVNPITLGHRVLEAPAAPLTGCDEPEPAPPPPQPTPPPPQPTPPPPPVVVNYTPPRPYFRGVNGGVYLRMKDDNGDSIDALIYEHDFYATQRLVDPNDGEVVVFKLHLPQDGVREFSIPLSELAAADKFRMLVGYHGIIATPQQMKAIMNYAIKYTKELQVTKQAREARLQFGWTDKRDAFVAGNKLYRPSGRTQHNPASSATSNIIHWLDPQGSLLEWKSIINTLAKPGMEPLQFAALCGFGSPLLPFSGVHGAVVNLMSNDSGTGKTTACQIANSVFGHPVHTMIIERDTQNAREHKMGVMKNLCVIADEMTNIRPEDLSDMVYAASQGRGKDRMESQTNRLRANTTRWQLIMLTNSNSSMTSKLAKSKARADGEMMRLIELPVDRVVVDGGDKIFEKLNFNYGVAGPIYAQWLVKNEAHLQKLVDKEKAALWKAVGKRIEERHIVGTAACVLVGGRIANLLGLHDLNIDNLRTWLLERVLIKREALKQDISDAQTLLGEFLNEHSTGIIGVNTDVLNPFSQSHVFYAPKSNKVVARFEAGRAGMLFVSRKAFRDYCVDRQYTMDDALNDYRGAHAPFQLVGTTKKRLLSGSGIIAPAVDALAFRCSPEEAEAIEQALQTNAQVEP
jgi:hypothetical protein